MSKARICEKGVWVEKILDAWSRSRDISIIQLNPFHTTKFNGGRKFKDQVNVPVGANLGRCNPSPTSSVPRDQLECQSLSRIGLH